MWCIIWLRMYILKKYRKVVIVFAAIFVLLISFLISQSTKYSIALAGVPQTVVPKGDDFYSVRSLLTQIAPLKYVNVTSEKSYAIESNISLIVFFDTNTPVSEKQKKELEKFLNNGGSAIFMVDGIYIPSGGKPTTASHNLFTFFSKYGIELQNNLVVSQSAEIASISTSQTAFASTYPLWVKTSNFNKSEPEFNAISHLVFPWSSSVEVLKSVKGKTNILVQSEKDSWTQKGQFSLAPNEVPIVASNLQKAYGLVAQTSTNSGGHILVIPSSRFVREQFLSTPPENTAFIASIAKTYFEKSSNHLRLFGMVWTVIYFLVAGIIISLIIIWRRAKTQQSAL